MHISPDQCRGARGLLGIDQAALASAASVSRNTIVSFESGQRVPGANNLAAIQRALEAAGIVFQADGETVAGGPGVRMRKGHGKVQT